MIARWLVAALLIVMTSPSLALDLSSCAPSRQVAAQSLEESYQEKSIAYGTTASGYLIEIFASKGGKTWTILVTDPEGKSCLFAMGQDWDWHWPTERAAR